MGKLAALAKRYIDGRQQRAELRAATARQERMVLRGFTRSYGDRPVEQLARIHIEHWLAHLTIGVSSRRTYLGIVRRFCRWLVEHRHIRRDPTTGIRTPRPPRTVPRALSPADVTAARRALPDERARCVVALMYDLGLRVGEVTRVELADVDLDARSVRIVGKGGHERQLPIVLTTIHAIRTYLAADPPRSAYGPLIRSSLDHRSPLTASYLSALVAGWLSDAGVKRAPRDGRSAHAFRHTAAGELADVEADLRVLQAFLGHANLSTTSIYLRRLDTGQLRAALDRRATETAG